jgi:redox-sensitive bicupin YhaK (pirin superfamily)
MNIRRNADRLHSRERNREIWRTFPVADRDEPFAGQPPFVRGFGVLENVTEDRLAARTSISKHSQRSTEVVTYVQEGTLAYEDSLGRSGITQAGQFQHTIVGNGVQQTQANASKVSLARVFRLSLRLANPDATPGLEQRRFSTADRRGALCLVASSDGRNGSLRMRQDVLVYSAIFDAGRRVVHELPPQRQAWLHIVQGAVVLGDAVLTAGDGAGLRSEHIISLTAQEESEILVVELRTQNNGRPQ